MHFYVTLNIRPMGSMCFYGTLSIRPMGSTCFYTNLSIRPMESTCFYGHLNIRPMESMPFYSKLSIYQTLECRSCRYFTWVRHFGPVLLGSGMQILSLFHVGAPLWACYAELWHADLVTISRRCATLGLLGWALECRSSRYFA